MTISEIQAELTKRNISFKKSAKKAELEALLNEVPIDPYQMLDGIVNADRRRTVRMKIDRAYSSKVSKGKAVRLLQQAANIAQRGGVQLDASRLIERLAA